MNGKEKKEMPFAGLLRLLAKQVLTTAICAILVLTAHFTGKQPFFDYTKALGDAIRYEINTDGLQHSGSVIWGWILNQFSQETEGEENE